MKIPEDIEKTLTPEDKGSIFITQREMDLMALIRREFNEWLLTPEGRTNTINIQSDENT
jgi:hypothetical protein